MMGRLDGRDRDPLSANLQRHLLNAITTGSLKEASDLLETYPQFFVQDAGFLVITARGLKGVSQAGTDKVCEYVWSKFAEMKVDLLPAYRKILSEEKGDAHSPISFKEMIDDILLCTDNRAQMKKDLFLASIPHDEIKKHQGSKVAFSRLHALTKDPSLLEHCTNAYKGKHLGDELGI